MICYGAISIFSVESKTCKNCEVFLDCAMAARETLNSLQKFGDISKQIKWHETSLKRLGLIDAEKKTRKNKKVLAEERQKEETEEFIQELTALGVIKDNRVVALERAPEYFRVVIEVLQMYGEISSSELLKSVKYKVTAGFALNSTAKTIQALAALGLVEVKTNKRTQVITWKQS